MSLDPKAAWRPLGILPLIVASLVALRLRAQLDRWQLAFALVIASTMPWNWLAATTARVRVVPPAVPLLQLAAVAGSLVLPLPAWVPALLALGGLVLWSSATAPEGPAPTLAERGLLGLAWLVALPLVLRGTPVELGLFGLLTLDLAVTRRGWTSESVAGCVALLGLFVARGLIRGFEPADAALRAEDLIALATALAVLANVILRGPWLTVLLTALRERVTSPPRAGEARELGRARAWGALALVALVGHALLLVHDVRLQDDWAYLAWIRAGDLGTLMAVNNYAGNPIMNGYFVPFTWLGEPLVAFRVVGFLSILATAVATFELARELDELTPRDDLAVASLACVYPAYMAHVSLTLSVFTFFQATFLGATLLAFRAEGLAGWRHAAARLAALAVFFASFTVNSLLVPFGAIVLLHALRIRRLGGLGWRATAWRYATRRLDFLLLPIVFWATKKAYEARFPTNPGYNKPAFALSLFTEGFRSFGEAFATQLGQALSPLPLAVGLVVALLALRSWRPGEEARSFGRLARASAVGAGLLLLGTFPYVAVAKPPGGDTEQWGTRVLLLAAAPLGLIFVSLAGMLEVFFRARAGTRHAILLALVLSSCHVRVEHYLRFLARSAETRSLLLNLARLEGAREVSVFGVASRLESTPVITTNYAWAYMLQEALGGGLTRFVFPEPVASDPATQARIYTTEEIARATADWWSRRYGFAPDPGGPQATLVIEPGETGRPHGDASVALRYLWYRLGRSEELDGFLRGLTRVTLVPKRRS